MATAPVIDIEGFVAPIPGDSPAGADIRADFSPQSAYFTVKDAQASARTEERKRREAYDVTPDTAFRPDDWNAVLKYAEDVLFEKSKDLEVAAWYVEALLRHYGFAGVRDGLRLVRRLTEVFWDGIYPRPDDEGLVTTVAPLATLSGADSPGTLIWPISNIPITATQPWGCWQYRQAQGLAGLEEPVLEEKVKEGAISLKMFEAAVAETPVEFYRDLLQDIEQALEECRQLSQLLDERCGVDDSGYPIAPSTRNIEEALSSALQSVRAATAGLVIDLPEAEPDAGAETAEGAGAAVAAAGGGVALPGGDGVMTREQAFRAIQQLSEFFKKSEPHSPVPYLLQKAVRWGRMPLPQLLHELIADQPMLSELYRVMGVEDSGESQNR